MPGGHHSQGPRTFVSLPPIKVLVTGAAGQVAYSLVFAIANGNMFGPDRRVILHLLDIPGMETKLEGLKLELEDVASDVLAGVVTATDYPTAFADIDVALLVGARPRGPGMERKDLLAANAAIFKGQGQALDTYAKKSVKVLVVGNPANTNALIASTHAPSIPRQNFTCLTRLDQNRAQGAIARRIGTVPSNVAGVLIWGNHSGTQFPDARFAMAVGLDPVRPYDNVSVTARLAQAEGGNGTSWLRGDFIGMIQERGKTVIDKRGASSAASAAQAICDHMRDWWCGSSGRMVSMGVFTAGGMYGLPDGLVFSLPVVCDAVEPAPGTKVRPETSPEDSGALPGGAGVGAASSTGTGAAKAAASGYRIITDLSLDEFSKARLDLTTRELLEERELALGHAQQPAQA